MQTVIPPAQNDLTLLLPAYRPKVIALLAAVTARGRKARLFETYRSDARCLYVTKKGASRNGLRSMHRYRSAVDIIDEIALWSDPTFFTVLGAEAMRLGLTWGGDWDGNPKTEQSFDDRPHVQAIPLGKQDIFRSLKDDGARDAYLVRYFASAERTVG